MSGMALCEPMDSMEVMDYAVPYASNDDILQARGPYDYGNTTYYIVQFLNEDEIYGELVLNGFTGEIIEDQKVCEKIFYTSTVMESSLDVTDDNSFYFSFKDNQELSSKVMNFIPLYQKMNNCLIQIRTK